MADEDRNPIDRALDAAVHLPVGLFLDAKDRVPELTEKGRQHVDSQVKVARMIGEFVVSIGTKELVKRFGHLFGAEPPDPDGAAPDPEQSTDAPAVVVVSTVDASEPASDASSSPAAPRASRKPRPARPARPAPPAASTRSTRPARLPIDGYDTLAASQVIARLDALAPAELESVRDYEAGHRNRKTILGRVAQLQRG